MNLARWKLVQNTLISVLVALLALEAGADPTAAVGVIAIINGLSLADLATIFGGGAPPMDQQQSRQQDDDSETAKKKKQQ